MTVHVQPGPSGSPGSPGSPGSAGSYGLSDLHRVVPLRDCSDAVMNSRTRPCLKYQIGLCSAPCVDLIDEAAYRELVERAMRILGGDTRELEADLEQRMDARCREQPGETRPV